MWLLLVFLPCGLLAFQPDAPLEHHWLALGLALDGVEDPDRLVRRRGGQALAVVVELGVVLLSVVVDIRTHDHVLMLGLDRNGLGYLCRSLASAKLNAQASSPCWATEMR